MYLLNKSKKEELHMYALKMIRCIDVVRIIGFSGKTETKFGTLDNTEVWIMLSLIKNDQINLHFRNET